MSKIKHYFSRMRKAINSNPVIGFGLVAIGIIVFGCLAFLLYGILSEKPVEAPDIAVTKKETKYYSALTGRQVKDEKAVNAAVTAIMIENSPDARPHSGLKQAGIVYEAIAEAGITRYLVLYQDQKPNTQIGPVRSLREYFVDWVAPYQASVAHVGGSSQALKLIRNGNYRDLDQFFNPDTFWRASDRYAPHNVYTNFKRLNAFNKQNKHTTSNFKSFTRTDGEAAKEPSVKDIKIDFSSPTYNTRYVYSAKNNNYVRHLGGVPHKDREKGTITPDVVVALRVVERTVMEDGAREQITTSGTGKATVFQNGQAINATWRKKSRSAPLELLDSEGKPVELVRGQTWIAAVPNGTGSVSW